MNSRIFQHNTFTTLSIGFYKGTTPLKEALTHGKVGIGTLDTANGKVAESLMASPITVTQKIKSD